MIRSILVILVAVFLVEAAEKRGTNQHLWADTPFTTHMWQTISSGNVDELDRVLKDNAQEVINSRSRDGRGPLWWAYEYQQDEMVAMLVKAGVSEEERDADGKTAQEIYGKIGQTQYAAAEEKEARAAYEAEMAAANAAAEADAEEDDE